MAAPTQFRLEERHGDAGTLHRTDLVEESVLIEESVLVERVVPTVWWCRPLEPAIVIGSAQAKGVTGIADFPDRDSAGRPVVVRRSGGGAVLVGEDEGIWVDVVIGRDDPRWDDDVSRSSQWLGEAWAAALADLGVVDASVWAGPLDGRWASQVCFGGRAAGEVIVDGAKLVGMSQRRSRRGARWQTHVLRRWNPNPLVAVAVEAPERDVALAELGDRGIGLLDAGASTDAPAAVVAALLRHLT